MLNIDIDYITLPSLFKELYSESISEFSAQLPYSVFGSSDCLSEIQCLFSGILILYEFKVILMRWCISAMKWYAQNTRGGTRGWGGRCVRRGPPFSYFLTTVVYNSSMASSSCSISLVLFPLNFLFDCKSMLIGLCPTVYTVRKKIREIFPGEFFPFRWRKTC